MTHHDETFLPRPAHLVFVPGAGDAIKDLRLMVEGQGTVGVRSAGGQPFTVTITAGDGRSLRWEIGTAGAALSEQTQSGWTEIASFPGAGLDPEPKCVYWFSVDGHNGRLRYGKGEMRLGTCLASHDVPAVPPDEHSWLTKVSSLDVEPPVDAIADVWRDPVTVEPPMRILPGDQITMDDMATGWATVAENLTAECQVLYGNVAGPGFALDTPDFRDFSRAIEASIVDPDGWCCKKLAEKANEFGQPNPKETYLRITLGVNQGESPGIPFVMEIWPPHHYSPIHNHGGADAVIKVLHGSIHVSLFAMLSQHHETPFAEADFGPGDVTWITPRLNQTHQLHNINADTTCVTIQCYQYAQSDDTHYPYFDYLESNGLGQFDPNSDMDFSAFKALMRQEQAGRRC